MTEFERKVLYAVHCAPYVDPRRQTVDVQDAIKSLTETKHLGPSCLKAGAVESTEKGARLLGYA